MMQKERQDILEYSASIRKICHQKEISCGLSQSQIIPIILGKNEDAVRSAQIMRDAGYYIKAIRAPTVPMGTARLRLSVTPFVAMCDAEKIIRHLV